MKLSDYVIDFMARQGVRHVFLVSGGAVIHLVDSASRHPKFQYICTQHEQGAGAAADGYSRVSENLGFVLVTSGPGATNLVTSVSNAYFDSIPVIFISGQVATFRLRPSKKLRQKGFQETDVVSIFSPITKYTVQVRKAADIRYELEKAIYFAKSGRPGPVLLDIPDDLQRENVEPAQLRSFKPPKKKVKKPLLSKLNKVETLIRSAKRPVLVLGAGVRMSHTEKDAIAFSRRYGIPIFLTWGAMDILPYDDEFNMGGFGVTGPRSGNFSMQNSDLVIAMGTRLSQMMTGGKQNLFASRAKKVMIDIDPAELTKFTKNDLQLDVTVQCDLRDFFAEYKKIAKKSSGKDLFADWRQQIQAWRKAYPICPTFYYERREKIDAHVFIKELSLGCKEGDIIIADTGGNLSWTLQAFEIKKDQRLFSAWNHSPMGYSLPAAIGAALAGNRDVICIIGDGGIMMCLQELATVRRHNLPVKIFIFNNHGHGIQKQTIETWLNGRYTAVDEKSGLSFPDFMKVAGAFNLPAETIENHKELELKLPEVLKMSGPVVCNVEIVENQKIVPMLKFGAGLEDLDPKIPAEELAKIMKVSSAL